MRDRTVQLDRLPVSLHRHVGGLERAYYNPAGLAKFETMPQLRLAYDADGVRIYEVQP